MAVVYCLAVGCQVDVAVAVAGDRLAPGLAPSAMLVSSTDFARLCRQDVVTYCLVRAPVSAWPHATGVTGVLGPLGWAMHDPCP